MKTAITVRADRGGIPLGDFYGIFFEDINHAADGGIVADLVQNGSFEFDPIDNAAFHALTAWEAVGDAALSVTSEHPLYPRNPHSLTIRAGRDGRNGVRNLGFSRGMEIRAGERYRFTFWARCPVASPVDISVALSSPDGLLSTEKKLRVPHADWARYEATLEASAASSSGRLEILLSGQASLCIDAVTLYPESSLAATPAGFRSDLVQLLAELKPRFLRFPGGCIVHTGSLDPDARDSLYRWKDTLGPREGRPSRRNNWGYNQSYALGYYEYFILSEAIGAKPLPVLPAAYNPHWKIAAPMDALQPWIDDALDLIEFANGDASTAWGRRRAEMGHPAPFGLEYLAIGNEEVGEAFFERYPLFHRAIRERYPDIKLINSSGPFAAGGEYERGWASARREGSDLVDEHYYQAPEWFIANHERYDSFDPAGPRVFLGEWASWGNTWYNALAEASYMTALERNADKVPLSCYAPLFCHVDYVNWRPDLIYFDNEKAFKTANYQVHQLFMANLGDESLTCEASFQALSPLPPPPLSGTISLSGNQIAGTFRHITVKNLDTAEVLAAPDITLAPGDAPVAVADIAWKRYAIEAVARRDEGTRGFFIRFAGEGAGTECFWELGGWQNQDSTVCASNAGRVSCLTQTLFEVQGGRDYKLRLEVDGRSIRTFIDGTLQDTAENRYPAPRPLYLSAARDRASGEIILKAVNLLETESAAEIAIEGFAGALEGTIREIAGLSPEAENSFEHPDLVSSRERAFTTDGPRFEHCFPPRSVSVWRLRPRNS